MYGDFDEDEDPDFEPDGEDDFDPDSICADCGRQIGYEDTCSMCGATMCFGCSEMGCGICKNC